MAIFTQAFGGGTFGLEIECLGFYHTLNWGQIEVTDTAGESVSNIVERYACTSLATHFSNPNSSDQPLNNGGIFYDDTNEDLVITNSAFNATRENKGSTPWEKLLKLVEPGDGVDDWVIGITPTHGQSGTRRFYYREANVEVEYSIRPLEGQIRTISGRLVDGWDVKPDRSVKIASAIRSLNTAQVDPEFEDLNWIRRVEYDGSSNVATWYGKDNLTVENLLKLKEVSKPIGGQFSNNRRLAFS